MEIRFPFQLGTTAAAFYHGLRKLNPFVLWRNPVLFMTEIGAALTTVDAVFLHQFIDPFALHLCVWLWITVIFANTARSLAEIGTEERALPLRQARSEMLACRYDKEGNLDVVSYREVKKGDLILVRKNEMIPADGEILSGSAAIDESNLTAEPLPIMRRSLSDTGNVTAGTRVITGEILIKVTANPGEGFLDKMIAIVEGSEQKKTQNELALTILFSSMCVIFLATVLSFHLFADYYRVELSISMQIALFTCLIPTTIAGLLNAVEIAGLNHLLKKNVIPKSTQAIEVAANVDVLFLETKDRIPSDLASRLKECAQYGIKTVLVTEETAMTVGADDFLYGATPEKKLEYLRQEQKQEHIVATTGEGISDVEILAAADLGLAMNRGVPAAKEAANMIDLDSHPDKIFEIIGTGTQLLMTKGALTTLSISADLAKYLIMLPSLLIPALPGFNLFNFLHLSSPKNAILSAVIFNAISLIALIPLAFRGVKIVPYNVGRILTKHLLFFGLGGFLLPLIGIKLIDTILSQMQMFPW